MDIQLFKLETEYIVGLAVQTLTSDLVDFKKENKHEL